MRIEINITEVEAAKIGEVATKLNYSRKSYIEFLVRAELINIEKYELKIKNRKEGRENRIKELTNKLKKYEKKPNSTF